MDLLSDSTWTPLFWLAVGIVLLIAEVLGAAGFLIGAAAAALVLALLTFLVGDIGFALQLAIYAFVAVFATLVYFKFFRKTDPKNESDLPSRGDSLVGRRFTLEEDLVQGDEIRAQLGDTMWRVQSDADLSKGTEVCVVSTDVMKLKVEAAA